MLRLNHYLNPFWAPEEVVGGWIGSWETELCRGTTHRSADRAHGDHRVILYAPGTNPSQKWHPAKHNLPHSLHVPEAAEFNPKGVIQLPLVYHVLFLRGKHVPSEPSLHIYYVSKSSFIHDLVSTSSLVCSIRCSYSMLQKSFRSRVL